MLSLRFCNRASFGSVHVFDYTVAEIDALVQFKKRFVHQFQLLVTHSASFISWMTQL